ncbi:hypothetical protein FQN57_006953 [Myotisia sp. PD_48]|nr:hypothetical protein FQN57_006953 [Myotisia sp. PD_48]
MGNNASKYKYSPPIQPNKHVNSGSYSQPLKKKPASKHENEDLLSSWARMSKSVTHKTTDPYKKAELDDEWNRNAEQREEERLQNQAEVEAGLKEFLQLGKTTIAKASQPKESFI